MFGLIVMMHFIVFGLSLLFLSVGVIAKDSNSDAELRTVGYTLANYEVCELLAKQNNDPVMGFYYAQMHQLSELEYQGYTEGKLQVIEKERAKALSLLRKVSSASMLQLCSNRFDPVSRQHYQIKLSEQ